MSNRDNFQWRPNDNSVKTNLRYDLEAAHWVKAFTNANTKTASLLEVLGTIGLIISFIFTAVLLIVLLVIKFITWIRKQLHRGPQIPEHLRLLTEEEIYEIDRELAKKRK